MKKLYGGIEAGGTKFVCAVGSCPDDLHNEIRFETTTPGETLGRAIDYFKKQNLKRSLASIGIGSFGPVNLNKRSEHYGYITSTPKTNWINTDFVGIMRKEFNIPIAFDTDVNAAAFGEHRWGSAQDIDNFIYLTIGTGIGGGAMVDGNLLHGMSHPEMGHIFIPQDIKSDPYSGTCFFHGNCFEGLASGPAINERWGIAAKNLPPDHKAWDLEAHYIALALVGYICSLSPQRIILGGGVMEQKQLFPLVRKKVRTMLNNYIIAPEITQNLKSYIVPTGLGTQSGILGAIALAEKKILDINRFCNH
ncbi:MAG: ROK family protein [Candidatus Theseobacter exili]|nr:ROK family protein [Candidatus Theseobacter exili]